MNIHQQCIAVVGTRPANARGEFGQPFLVAVRRFAVGDIENRRRVTFAVIPHRTPVPDQFVRMQQRGVHRRLSFGKRRDPLPLFDHRKERPPVGKPPLPLHLPARSVAFIQFRRFDDQTLSFGQ